MKYEDPRPEWARGNSKWTYFWLRQAVEISKLSKDPSTQVGAVIARDQLPLSYGYNGIVRGMLDSHERLTSREQKLKFTEHGEANAILNALRNGVDVRGSTIYVTHFPCVSCARSICQSGITQVVNVIQPDFEERWKESLADSREIFDEVGISTSSFSSFLLE